MYGCPANVRVQVICPHMSGSLFTSLSLNTFGIVARSSISANSSGGRLWVRSVILEEAMKVMRSSYGE